MCRVRYRSVRAAAVTVAVVFGSDPAVAQRFVDERSFPLEELGEGGRVRFESQHGKAAAGESVRFTGVELPDGTAVDLLVQRADPARLGFGFVVDGVEAPTLLELMELDVFVGTVDGMPGSSAALAFSPYGSRGWVRRGTELFHLLAAPGPGGDWSRSTSEWVSEEALLALGNRPQPPCGYESLPSSVQTAFVRQVGTQASSLTVELYECRVAVETDDQLFAVFGNLLAESTYVTTLLTWVSYRYEEQAQLVLTYPYVGFYTQGNDPWTTQDVGGTTLALLAEFQAAWNASGVPAGGRVGTFLSGAALGGGQGYRPGVCVPGAQYSVSTGIAGGVQFPVVQQGGNWDFYVAAHELGHNFGAPHTHEWCPPIDECAPQQFAGPCQTQMLCSSQGTLMSYCQLCAGSTANITTYFHPLSIQAMRSWIENNCLPLYLRNPEVYCAAKANSQGCTPAIDVAGYATLTGLDDFHVTASNVINQEDGLLFYGLAQTAKPFQGGTKCVLAPTWRTPVQSSGGTVGSTDCSGTYDLYLSHAFLQARGLVAGTTLYAQYWTRDTGSPSGTGLTDALKIRVVN